MGGDPGREPLGLPALAPLAHALAGMLAVMLAVMPAVGCDAARPGPGADAGMRNTPLT